MTEEEKDREYRAWLETRPENVRAVAARFRPWRVHKCLERRCFIVSFDEELSGRVSLTVEITQELNPGMLLFCDRQVFGVDPADVVEVVHS